MSRREKNFTGFDDSIVGFCKNLDHFEATALSYLRLWSDGIEGKKKAERDFIINLGYVEGYKAARALDDLYTLILRKAGKKLVFQSIDDAMYTQDELNFVELVVNSADDVDENGCSMAALLLPLQLMPLKVQLARQVGNIIKQGTLKTI